MEVHSPSRARQPDNSRPASEPEPAETWYVVELRVGFKMKAGHHVSPETRHEIRTIAAALGEVAVENIETALPAGSFAGLGAGAIRFGQADADLAKAFERTLVEHPEPAFSAPDNPDMETMQ